MTIFTVKFSPLFFYFRPLSLLDPDIHFSILCSDILNLCYFFGVRDWCPTTTQKERVKS
jgi:hypothetical protein